MTEYHVKIFFKKNGF